VGIVIDWPQLDELKQRLDLVDEHWDGSEDSGDGPTRLTRLLMTAVAKVKQDVGAWDEYEDEPDAALAEAALRLAELMALKPEVLAAVTRGAIVGDPAYQSMLYGHRRTFGIG
jgi:hypothetical protein